MSKSYIPRALTWCREVKKFPPLTAEVKNRGNIVGNLMLGSDMLLTAYQKEDLGVMPMILANHLVQHTGVNSARLSMQNLPTLNFARTKNFPYVEGYTMLDENEWW